LVGRTKAEQMIVDSCHKVSTHIPTLGRLVSSGSPFATRLFRSTPARGATHDPDHRRLHLQVSIRALHEGDRVSIVSIQSWACLHLARAPEQPRLANLNEQGHSGVGYRCESA
jgi:hypothetical protein